MAYNETPISERQAMLIVAVAITGIVLGAVATRLFDMRKFNQLHTTYQKKDMETWSSAFSEGWKAASKDFTNVKACYERLTNPYQD